MHRDRLAFRDSRGVRVTGNSDLELRSRKGHRTFFAQPLFQPLPNEGGVPKAPLLGDAAQLLGQLWLKPNRYLCTQTRLVFNGRRRGVILPSAVVGGIL